VRAAVVSTVSACGRRRCGSGVRKRAPQALTQAAPTHDRGLWGKALPAAACGAQPQPHRAQRPAAQAWRRGAGLGTRERVLRYAQPICNLASSATHASRRASALVAAGSSTSDPRLSDGRSRPWLSSSAWAATEWMLRVAISLVLLVRRCSIAGTDRSYSVARALRHRCPPSLSVCSVGPAHWCTHTHSSIRTGTRSPRAGCGCATAPACPAWHPPRRA
jgi:hypothetical protein